MFDGILEMFGGSAAGAALGGLPWGPIAALGAAALGYEGQEQTNQMQMGLAQNQMDFQREMSNTAYQRAVADMKAAGLNPMLAYSQGGASTPGGAMATIGNKTAAATNAAAAATQMQNTQAQTANIKADTQLKGAQTTQTLSSAGHLDALKDNIRQDMKMFEDRWEKLRTELHHAQSSAGIRRNELGMSNATTRNQLHERAAAQLKQLQAEAENLYQQARITGMKVPEAIAEARFWSGPDSKSAVYFRHAPKNLTSAATGAMGAAADDLREGFNLRYKGQR